MFSTHDMEANMGAGRPKAELVLNESEREQLQVWARRRKTAQALALRSRTILACSEGAENKAVAAQLAIAKQTVCKWRGRFLQLRLNGLLDAPRSGTPRTIDDARVDAVIAKTLETQPMNATHWSTRTMARFRSAASSSGNVQAFHRPAVRREDTRYCGPVHRSASQGNGALR